MEHDEDSLATPTQEIPDPPLEIMEEGRKDRSEMWRAVLLFAVFGATSALALVPAAKLPTLLAFIGLSEESAEVSGPISKPRPLGAAGATSKAAPTAPSTSGPARFVYPTQNYYSTQIVQATPIPGTQLVEPTGTASTLQTSTFFNGQSLDASLGPPEGSGQGFFGFASPQRSAPEDSGSIVDRAAWVPPVSDAPPDGGLASSVGGGAPMSQSSRPEGEIAAAISSPSWGSNDVPPRVEAMVVQLQGLGAVRYRLERWGQQGKLYRFSCEMPVPGVPGMTRLWEAVAPTGEKAVAEVLRSILQDRAHTLRE